MMRTAVKLINIELTAEITSHRIIGLINSESKCGIAPARQEVKTDG
jgi:hypothetical protein